MKQIEAMLFEKQDLVYRDFHAKLVPNIDKDTIIGVQVPVLRKLANQIACSEYVDEFLNDLPHKYFEENHLHSFIVTKKYQNIDELLEKVEEFLPFINNWAICDSFINKVFIKYPEIILPKIKLWLASDHTYVVRYGVVTLLNSFLNDNFEKAMLDWVTSAISDEYYINMAIAWYFSMALIKQYDITLPLIQSKTLPKWIQNKSIQKARESFRIDKETKNYLNTLKI
ncbi:MAG: DNA alkylation repair protein [Clostridia bacterium]